MATATPSAFLIRRVKAHRNGIVSTYARRTPDCNFLPEELMVPALPLGRLPARARSRLDYRNCSSLPLPTSLSTSAKLTAPFAEPSAVMTTPDDTWADRFGYAVVLHRHLTGLLAQPPDRSHRRTAPAHSNWPSSHQTLPLIQPAVYIDNGGLRHKPFIKGSFVVIVGPDGPQACRHYRGNRFM